MYQPGRWAPPGAPLAGLERDSLGTGCQARSRSAQRLPRSGAPAGGSAPGPNRSRRIFAAGEVEGRKGVPPTPDSRLPTSRSCARERGPRDLQKVCPDISGCSLPASRGTRRATDCETRSHGRAVHATLATGATVMKSGRFTGEVGRRTEERHGEYGGRQVGGETKADGADRVLHLLRISCPSRRSGGESAARLPGPASSGDDRPW